MISRAERASGRTCRNEAHCCPVLGMEKSRLASVKSFLLMASPPALIEGKTYDVFTPTYNANGGGVRFVIKGELTREMKYLQRNNPLLLIF